MSGRTRGFRRLAWAAVGATLALVVLGGVVRITGSGLGCGDDWPLCHGRLLPPLDAPTLIEYGHRLAASVVSVLVAALLVLAWTRHRRSTALRRAATLAAGLLAAQVLLGAVTVWLHLPAASVVLHLATAMLLLAALIVTALRAGPEAAARPPEAGAAGRPVSVSRSAGFARAAIALAFATLVLGALVANLGAAAACGGFPLCNGKLLPGSGEGAVIHWLHRIMALSLLAVLVALVAGHGPRRTGRDEAQDRVLAGLSVVALALGILQGILGAGMVTSGFPPALRAAHLAVGALLWSALVALVHESSRPALIARRSLPLLAERAEAAVLHHRASPRAGAAS